MGLASAPPELRAALETASAEARADFIAALYLVAVARGLMKGVKLAGETRRALDDLAHRAGLIAQDDAKTQAAKLEAHYQAHPLSPVLLGALAVMCGGRGLEDGILRSPSAAQALIGTRERSLPAEESRSRRNGGSLVRAMTARFERRGSKDSAAHRGD